MEGMLLSTGERDRKFAVMADRYRPMIKGIISRYLSNVGDYRIDTDELYQEGLIALYHAAIAFKGRDIDFERYAYVVVRRWICRKISSAYKMYTHEMVSIDRDDYAESSILFYKASDRNNEPARLWHIREYADGLNGLYNSMTDMQKAICDLRSEGKKYAEIANDLGISKKKVDNEIQKIRHLIRIYEASAR